MTQFDVHGVHPCMCFLMWLHLLEHRQHKKLTYTEVFLPPVIHYSLHPIVYYKAGNIAFPHIKGRKCHHRSNCSLSCSNQSNTLAIMQARQSAKKHNLVPEMGTEKQRKLSYQYLYKMTLNKIIYALSVLKVIIYDLNNKNFFTLFTDVSDHFYP